MLQRCGCGGAKKADIKEELRDALAEVAQQRARLDEVEARSAALEGEISASREDEEARSATLENEMAGLREGEEAQSQRLEAQSQRLEAQMAVLREDEEARLQREAAEALAERQRLEAELGDDRREHAMAMERQRHSFELELQRAELETSSEQRVEHAQALERLRTAFQERNSEGRIAQAVQTQVSKFRKQATKAENQVVKLRREVDAAAGERPLRRLEEQVAMAARQEKEELQEALGAEGRRCSDLQAQVAVLQAELSQQRRTQESLEGRLGAAETELQLHGELQAQVRGLQEELEARDEELQDTQQRLREVCRGRGRELPHTPGAPAPPSPRVLRGLAADVARRLRVESGRVRALREVTELRAKCTGARRDPAALNGLLDESYETLEKARTAVDLERFQIPERTLLPEREEQEQEPETGFATTLNSFSTELKRDGPKRLLNRLHCSIVKSVQQSDYAAFEDDVGSIRGESPSQPSRPTSTSPRLQPRAEQGSPRELASAVGEALARKEDQAEVRQGSEERPEASSRPPRESGEEQEEDGEEGEAPKIRLGRHSDDEVEQAELGREAKLEHHSPEKQEEREEAEEHEEKEKQREKKEKKEQEEEDQEEREEEREPRDEKAKVEKEETEQKEEEEKKEEKEEAKKQGKEAEAKCEEMTGSAPIGRQEPEGDEKGEPPTIELAAPGERAEEAKETSAAGEGARGSAAPEVELVLQSAGPPPKELTQPSPAGGASSDDECEFAVPSEEEKEAGSAESSSEEEEDEASEAEAVGSTGETR